jgi:integration host factor subunit alpha
VTETRSSTPRSTPRNAWPSRERSPGTVTKADIARAICARTPSVSFRQAKNLIDAIIGEIVPALAAGQSLRLHNFGSFSIRLKGERLGRNPRNGVAAMVSARRVVNFRASAKLKAVVADGSRA